jgi:hypothetical protein
MKAMTDHKRSSARKDLAVSSTASPTTADSVTVREQCTSKKGMLLYGNQGYLSINHTRNDNQPQKDICHMMKN